MTFSGGAVVPVTVNYATANGTAAAGSDYTATSGTLTFKPGVTPDNQRADVNARRLRANERRFTVTLSNAVGATSRGDLECTIYTTRIRSMMLTVR